MTTIWTRTHLCADDDTKVTIRTDSARVVFIELGGNDVHGLTISGRPEAVTTLLLKAAALVIERTEEVSA